MKTPGCAQSDLQFFSRAKVEAPGRGRPEEKQGTCPGWRDASQIPFLPSHLPIGMTDTEAFPFLTKIF